MKILITGGAGFIGSSLVKFLIKQTNHKILILDKLTYAGSLYALAELNKNSRYKFIKGNICDQKLVSKILINFEPNVIMHLAAESHVDRSIDKPFEFIHTNVLGTYNMLDCALKFWMTLSKKKKKNFLFHHTSTDEVFGSLGKNGLFTEKTPYDPSSPYSASKASSDHLVRAWGRTYGLPVIITNCSNNYGPYQFPEKLIPLIILSALDGKSLPVYGTGEQVRDWIYVEDHVKALYKVITKGKVGETYNIGGLNQKKNLEVVQMICDLLDELCPEKLKNNSSFKDQIKFVDDRPGHDQRYAIDNTKITQNLNWRPKESFESGLRKTVSWYLDNLSWSRKIQDNVYNQYRLGL